MSRTTKIERLVRHAREVQYRDRPDCWLFRIETVREIDRHYDYDAKIGRYGNGPSLTDMIETDDDTLTFYSLPLHVARTDLQYEAVLHYLTEVKGLRVAIRKDEKP